VAQCLEDLDALLEADRKVLHHGVGVDLETELLGEFHDLGVGFLVVEAIE